MPQDKKHVHFIGICGVAMAPIAKMFLDLGWKVSGSDAGFFPPMSDYLKQYPRILFYPGFHPEKVGTPSLVVVGNFIGLNNPEFIYAKEQGIPIKSYPEVLEEFVVKENSVVVAGTYGKTTIAALIAWILECAGYNPSYMAGGIVQNMTDGVRSTHSAWSVIEGDEYPADRESNTSKFFYYHPTHLILTSVEWDHMDVFPTEESFVNNFKKFIHTLPEQSIVIANEHGENVSEVLRSASMPIVYYSGSKVTTSHDIYHAIHQVRDGAKTEVTIEHLLSHNTLTVTTSLIGGHMIDNIVAAVALSDAIGISHDVISKAIASFKGVKRRLELRGTTKTGALVIDDLAHSPPKARAGIKALGHWFGGQKKIFVVFEPNIGNRTKESLPHYDHVFDLAQEVIIPRLSSTKTKAGEYRLNGKELVEHIKRTQPNVKYIEDDKRLIDYLNQNTHKSDVIAFMGSHGFRGMIEEVLA